MTLLWKILNTLKIRCFIMMSANYCKDKDLACPWMDNCFTDFECLSIIPSALHCIARQWDNMQQITCHHATVKSRQTNCAKCHLNQNIIAGKIWKKGTRKKITYLHVPFTLSCVSLARLALRPALVLDLSPKTIESSWTGAVWVTDPGELSRASKTVWTIFLFSIMFLEMAPYYSFFGFQHSMRLIHVGV